MLVTMAVVFLAALPSNHFISYKSGKQLAVLVLVGLQAVFCQG